LVRAGEAAGNLTGALNRLGEMLDRSERIKEKVRSALIYPILLLVMIAVVMAVVLTFVIPAFEPFFEDMWTQLPLSTQIVLNIGGFVGAYGWALIAAFILCGIGLASLMRRPNIAIRKDRWLFSTRLLLGMPQKREVGEFCRTLGEMLSQGARLQSAFESAGDVARNLAFKAAIEEISVAVREGGRIGPELEGCGLFPDIAVRLVKLGEESGNLPQVLGRIGVLFETQVELAIERLLAILVPALTIIMGLIVAGFIGSILVGLMSVTNF
jgi:general secretion pathway protein F